MNADIGLVVALNVEASALIGHGRWQHEEGCLFRRFRLMNSTHIVVARSGIGVKRASTASERLIRKGVAALGVSGVSGGLTPELGPGDLVIADAVIHEKGDTCRQTWAESSKWVDRVFAAFVENGIRVYRGPIITVQKPVLSARNKQALFLKTRALAADMESAAVAAAANHADLPFFAFRAVCDPASCSISDDLFHCIDQKGRLRLPHLLRMVLLHPAFISELLRMKRNFGAALANLSRAWNLAVPEILPSLVVPRSARTISEQGGA